MVCEVTFWGVSRFCLICCGLLICCYGDLWFALWGLLALGGCFNSVVVISFALWRTSFRLVYFVVVAVCCTVLRGVFGVFCLG